MAVDELNLHPLDEPLPDWLKEDWIRLWSNSAERFPATHPVWVETHLRHLTSKADRSFLAVTGGAQSKLMAALTVDTTSARFINHPAVTDFNDFCVAPRDLEYALNLLLAGLAGQGVRTLVLDSLASDSATLSALRENAPSQGWTVTERIEDEAPAVPLPADWASYVQSLSKKNRHELRRKLHRIEDSHTVERAVFATAGAIESHMEDFFALLKVSTTAKAEFLTAPRTEFMRDLAIGMAEHGLTRLAVMSIDSQKSAATLYFECGTAHYTYNSGRNPLHKKLSNGIINHALGIKHAIECGMNRYDLMRGDERYKHQIGGGLATRQLVSATLKR